MTQTPDGNRYDLVVIGAGPAGEKGAAQAAYFGKRVAIIEAREVGGSAVNTGTLPSKTLRETALYFSGFKQRGLYGIDYTFDRDVTVDDITYRKKTVVATHQELVRENIERHGIDTFAGEASFVDPSTVRVTLRDGGTVDLAAEVVLIATGSRPNRPPDIPFDGRFVYDSDDILQLAALPRSLAVIGAGVVGCEYATLFAAMGVEVTLVDSGERLLPFIDHEVSDVLQGAMQKAGIDHVAGRRVASLAVRPGEAGVDVTLSDGDTRQTEAVLFCGGRTSNIEGLELERIGVTTSGRGKIDVDDHFRTSVPNIYAAGDVIGFPALASTSMEQARVAICHAFGFEYKQAMSPLVPYGLYTIPEVSTVGTPEQTLIERGEPYVVGRAFYRGNPRGQIVGDSSGLLKLLVEPETQRLHGVHIVGELATELIHIGQACMYHEGTIDFFIQNVFNFPTLSDMYKYAAYDALGNIQRRRYGAD